MKPDTLMPTSEYLEERVSSRIRETGQHGDFFDGSLLEVFEDLKGRKWYAAKAVEPLLISDDLVQMIHDEAKTRDLSVEKYLKTMVQREKTIVARQKIEQEQEWWLGQSLSERTRYEGECVAVHNQALVDHDRDEAKLYKRIRARYGNIPVLIMPAEGLREIRIFSPRISD